MTRQEEDETWATYACDAEDLLQEFESALLGLEHGRDDREDVNRLYRALHTLKGNSGLLGLRNLERLAHKAEDLVALVRDQGVPLTAGLMEQLLLLVDTLQDGLRDIGETQRDIDPTVAERVVADVDTWLTIEAPGSGEQLLPTTAAPEEGFELWSVDEVTAEGGVASPGPQDEGVDEPNQAQLDAAAGNAEPSSDASSSASVPVTNPTVEGKEEKSARATSAEKGGDYLRVHSRKIGAIMDLAGELTLASAALILGAPPELREREGFATAAHKLEALIRDLQTEVSAVRLVPIANAFDRMRRVVRDAAQQTGKSVDLRIVGEDTEIDKLMVDGLYEPLVHAVRNAVDHGLESPEERRAAGKLPTGRIVLEASSLGSEVVVRVSDDGRGLDPEKVRARAVERGLITHNTVLDERGVADLIFQPGFSTAAAVSTLSGRGVGMDVVRTAVERLRGTVTFESERGRGSSLIISAPVSLAFVESMVMRSSDHLYALPIERVHEVFRVRQEQIRHSKTEGTRLQVRERLVPVLWLDEYYGVGLEQHLEPGQIVAVVQNAHGRVAVPIEEVLGTESIMFKQLHPAMAQIRGAAGCGMLRSGEIALALNCDQLM